MRKLLYIPYSQDGFLPSCFHLFPAQALSPLHNLLFRKLFNYITAFRKKQGFFENILMPVFSYLYLVFYFLLDSNFLPPESCPDSKKLL